MIVSAFKNVKDVNNPVNRDVMIFLNRIKNGAQKDKIEQLRKGNKEIKQQLPGVCFSGKFKRRSDKDLIEHSGLIILDFDKVGDPTDLKAEICVLPYVFAAFTSPSGDGLKVLVRCLNSSENHKMQYLALVKEINSPHLDESGKDISRFCFESYDPDIFINENAKVFKKMESLDIEDIGYNSEDVTIPLTSDHEIIQRLQIWFDKKYSITEGSRNNSIFKFAIALNDFGVSKNVSESHLIKYSQQGFGDREIQAIVKSAYSQGVSTFDTKKFEDYKKKKEVEKKVFLGRSKKDIENEFPEVSDEALLRIREKNDSGEFWRYSQSGSLSIVPNEFKTYLEQNNYHKFFPTGTDTYTFIRRDGSLIDETNEKHIKDFVLDDLLNRDGIGFAPYNFMANKVQFFTPQYLSLIGTADVTIKRDTQDKCYLYYRNCVVEVTKDKRNIIDYIDLDGYVWRNRVIDRDYKEADHHEAEYRRFLWLVAGEDEKRYDSLKSIIGYLLHSYKTSSKNKAIILNDEVISENPNGGSGKGLFTNALAKLKKVSTIDGKTFDFQKSFPYQTVSADTQILAFDDVKKNFNFEALFSVITEGITLEYKNQPALKIPVEDSPKILITTNYTVGGVGGSFERRKFEVEFSSYFGAHYTPEQEFGHMLFDDWDEDEWQRFDNYMINCVEFYLEKGLVNHDFKNLKQRKFIKETSFEFNEWTEKANEAFKLNERQEKGLVYNQFIEEYQDYKKWLTQKRFKKWLESYAKYYNYTYSEGVSVHRWFMIETPDGQITEDAEGEYPF